MVSSRSTANGRGKGKGRATEFDEDDNDDAFDDDELDGHEDGIEPRQAAPPAAGPSQSQRHHQQPNGTAAANGHGEDDDDRDPAPVGPTPSIVPGEEREEDCIKILLATDNHIGYNERDPVRGRDSIETFKEILQLAVANEVDMLLLAGDLFHENKPSRGSLHQTIALMREYCMGPRPIALEVVSDVGIGLQTGYDFPPINYEDSNYNIALPCFSIHGNHDDPQGAGPEGALCALDILSASGLVNYFGRQELPGEASTDAEARESGIQVKPVLLKKGDTKLAMYGVGNIRDERFHAEMRKNRISMFRPAEDAESWFNLLLIHQNRVAHGPKSSVPENGFGDEVDLIVWGHEHDCRIDPEPVTGKGYYISQPGSSVATSLAAGEAIPKHVGLLKIQGRAFNMEKIRLRTVRPFVFDDVVLTDIEEIEGTPLDTKLKVNKYLKRRVNELIEKANAEWDELYADEDEIPARPLPLVRLRVEYSTGHEIGNPQRFGQDFTNKVANPRDIVQFSRKKTISKNKKITIDQPEGLDPANFEGELPERIEKIKVETLVRQYLEAQTLQMLHENGIGHAVNAFVEKDDKHAIESFITKTLETQRKEIERADRTQAEQADTDEEIEQGMHSTKAKLAEQFAERTSKKGKGKAARQAEEEEEEGSDFDRMSVDGGSDASGTAAASKKKGKSSTAASKTAASKSKASTSTKGKKKQLFNNDSEQDEEEEEEEEASSSDPPPAKKAPARKTAAAAKAPTAAAKKKAAAAAGSQSQLAFAPARTGRAAAKASTSKTKKAVQADSDEEAAASQVISMSSSSEDEAPKRKAATRKR